jgi:uncharacterized protein (UPF0371 family)
VKLSKKIGFDNDVYLKGQTTAIIDRVKMFGDKLYLEFGGKLLFDYHAARVLPGFNPNVKMELLKKLKNKADILLCIYAGDIERKKVRADFGITYDSDALKLIDDLKEWGIDIVAVVITRFDNQPAAKIFKNKLERRNIKVYVHRYTKGYPTDVDTVVVTGPGPGSGKLATCLSQLYHEHKRGAKAGYAKLETFPVWNLPLKHPVNVAYEAATADIFDFNQVDPFHLESHQKTAINYNRDIEIFPVLRSILEKISGTASIYKSPTDMGVNKVGSAITDDGAVQEAAKQELIRRFFRYTCEFAMGFVDKETSQRVELLMNELGVKLRDRKVVAMARSAASDAQRKEKGNEGIFCGAAIELDDGTFITGNNSPLMHAASSVVINAIKHLAGIPKKIHLLPQNITQSIGDFKTNILNTKSASLDMEETLIALSISGMVNSAAQLAIEKINDLKNCEMHMTHIPTPGDEAGLRRLGINVTSDPDFSTKNLFIK